MAVADLNANKVSEGLGVYAVAFLDSAVALFGRANDGHGLVDFAFYPAAYCFRHGIELFVKQISIYVAYELRDPRLLYEVGHGLSDPWKRVAESAEWIVNDWSTGSAELRHSLDVVNTAIEDVAELDAGGNLFRYPEFVKNANAAANKPRTRVDTHVPFDSVNLADWHATAAATLSAAQSLLYEWSERANDLRAVRNDLPGPLSDLVEKGKA